MGKALPRLEDLELIEIQDIKCPIKEMRHKGAVQYVLRAKGDHKPITSWFYCRYCSPKNWAPPRDAAQAFQWWLARSRPKNSKWLIQGGAEAYELLRQKGQCRNCGDEAVLMKLRPQGGRIVAGWFLCDRCSPADFYLPESAQEAYERWQRKLQRQADTEVVDAFLPAQS